MTTTGTTTDPEIAQLEREAERHEQQALEAHEKIEAIRARKNDTPEAALDRIKRRLIARPSPVEPRFGAARADGPELDDRIRAVLRSHIHGPADQPWGPYRESSLGFAFAEVVGQAGDLLEQLSRRPEGIQHPLWNDSASARHWRGQVLRFARVLEEIDLHVNGDIEPCEL